MRPLLPLALILIASLTTARAAFTWAPCTPEGSAKPPLLTPTAVTLVPDPPVIGGDVVFGVDGTASSAAASGTIGLRVKYEGVDLYEEQGPLCEKVAGKGCPIEAGQEAKIEYRQSLPPIAPPGHYGVRVIATTDGSSTHAGPGWCGEDLEPLVRLEHLRLSHAPSCVGRAIAHQLPRLSSLVLSIGADCALATWRAAVARARGGGVSVGVVQGGMEVRFPLLMRVVQLEGLLSNLEEAWGGEHEDYAHAHAAHVVTRNITRQPWLLAARESTQEEEPGEWGE